ncbi:MAG TPA: sulfite reductase [Syntrophobacteraceae bacterium]|nr:sulfite reductase [Syntrophobacteraceae bacterium]
MKWSEAAERAVSRTPFLVRKRIRKSVEDEALRQGAQTVHVDHVESCRQRMFGQMETEIQGYRVEACFGFSGCPNHAFGDHDDVSEVERELKERDLKGFLKTRVRGPLKFHHEFRVSISACPNACSQPQIVDFGLIGARLPKVTTVNCDGCGACVAICREGAVSLEGDSGSHPRIDNGRCLACGQCINVCPSEALVEAAKGFRILLGGKLGRHPQLGRELPGSFAPQVSLCILKASLDFYLRHNIGGERFGEVLLRVGADLLADLLPESTKTIGLI